MFQVPGFLCWGSSKFSGLRLGPDEPRFFWGISNMATIDLDDLDGQQQEDDLNPAFMTEAQLEEETQKVPVTGQCEKLVSGPYCKRFMILEYF